MPQIVEAFSTLSLHREWVRLYLSSGFRLKVAQAMRMRWKDPLVSMTKDGVAVVQEALLEDSRAFSELIGESIMP